MVSSTGIAVHRSSFAATHTMLMTGQRRNILHRRKAFTFTMVVQRLPSLQCCYPLSWPMHQSGSASRCLRPAASQSMARLSRPSHLQDCRKIGQASLLFFATLGGARQGSKYRTWGCSITGVGNCNNRLYAMRGSLRCSTSRCALVPPCATTARSYRGWTRCLVPRGGGGGAGARERSVGGHFAVCRRGTSAHSARAGGSNSPAALHCAVGVVLCARFWGPNGWRCVSGRWWLLRRRHIGGGGICACGG